MGAVPPLYERNINIKLKFCGFSLTDTAQNLQSPKEVAESISSSMTLSCFTCALLKGMVRHTGLVMSDSSFKVTSVQVSAFPRYWQLCIAVAPLTNELGSRPSGRSVLCPITQLSKQQCLRTESGHVGVEPVLSIVQRGLWEAVSRVLHQRNVFPCKLLCCPPA